MRALRRGILKTGMSYRGRFAPSPTGPLHFGSLITAVASWLDARAAGGEWLVRIEDVDAPRCRVEHETQILRALEAHGLHWDGAVARQSDALRQARYAECLERLTALGRLYPCGCSRKEIADSAVAARDHGETVYPGTCRNGLRGRPARAWRVRVDEREVCWVDRLFGGICRDLATDCGDFVVRRADGLYAYQLAVVVDDAGQGVTDVVRGADLLDSTPRQLWLQQLLGYATPRYLHVPVAMDGAGEKLSKQTRAAPLGCERAAANLRAVNAFLRQAEPPEELRAPEALLAWMTAHWDASRIPRQRGLRVHSGKR
jgi:glutamyl-Q tRNA(Asp) synthetase